MSVLATHRLADLDAAGYAKLLQRKQSDLRTEIEQVRPLIEAVKKDGDAAIVEYARQLDGVELSVDNILVTNAEMATAREEIDAEMLAAIVRAGNNILKYHERQLVESTMHELAPGVKAGERVLPLDCVACYTPRGKGAFPIVTLMTCIPAGVARVREVVLFTPPRKDGSVDAATLVAAELGGATLIAKAGGALAVAAAAFGTQSIPKCSKIEGPGSPWFVAAKKLLADQIASRLPAGPSESIIVADASVPAHKVALDLLIESEHGEDSSVFLVTWDEAVASQVAALVPKYLAKMNERCQVAAKAVLGGANGGVVLTTDAAQAYKFVNDYAPEHLQLMTKEPQADLEHITNAAEVLLGEHTPGSIANYMLGPNCVLPTGGAAVTHSALGVADFQKRMTVAQLDAQGYAALAPHTKRFAEYEGFSGHANAVSELRDNE